MDPMVCLVITKKPGPPLGGPGFQDYRENELVFLGLASFAAGFFISGFAAFAAGFFSSLAAAFAARFGRRTRSEGERSAGGQENQEFFHRIRNCNSWLVGLAEIFPISCAEATPNWYPNNHMRRMAMTNPRFWPKTSAMSSRWAASWNPSFSFTRREASL